MAPPTRRHFVGTSLTAAAAGCLAPVLGAAFPRGTRQGRPNLLVVFPDQMRAQIRAVEDAGLTEWLFWNPNSLYPTAAFQ